ncbi:MAG TPA: pseudouridine synthase [Verrucomicrobiae bacterium]|nr:pseudouridine synthase [Verrucomicrobiae bacterium]
MPPPCIIFEDDHLLVINKSAGLNTHAPSPFAGEGLYDWLRHREPRWAKLAIIHRLDKETSGVIVFGKTTAANRSLTDQFTNRSIQKKYLLLTDRPMKRDELIVKSKIARMGERYATSPQGEPAETRFKHVAADVRRLIYPGSAAVSPARTSQLAGETPALPGGSSHLIEAEPLTGRTHQIRVHAAENGFPILGDTLYGGSPFPRVCLHAAEIILKHPLTAEQLIFCAPANFEEDPREALRTALIDTNETNAFRLIHGASDGWPGWYVERLGDFLLSQSDSPLNAQQQSRLESALRAPIRGVYHKILSRHIRGASATEASPQLVLGEAAPERFSIRENGLQFELSFNEGYSVGIFLDQRDNRRRLLTGHIAADFPLLNPKLETRNSKPELLNLFAYTCAFSVSAAKAGAKTTSLDLSKKYLEWGRRNFALNSLDPAEHDFIYGDAFDWLRRLAKKSRVFDAIVLDPPTFSQSKVRGAFRVEKNYGELVSAALPLLKPEGVLLASTNAADWPPEKFLATVIASIRTAKRKTLRQHYVPQPPDFPVSRTEPAYLKTVWLQVS